jgi:PAS domain S-box-containing protein
MPDREFFCDAFNSSPIGIAVETLQGTPLFVNPALYTMLDFTEAELRNKHCQDFSPPEDAQKDWVFPTGSSSGHMEECTRDFLSQ